MAIKIELIRSDVLDAVPDSQAFESDDAFSTGQSTYGTECCAEAGPVGSNVFTLFYVCANCYTTYKAHPGPWPTLAGPPLCGKIGFLGSKAGEG